MTWEKAIPIWQIRARTRQRWLLKICRQTNKHETLKWKEKTKITSKKTHIRTENKQRFWPTATPRIYRLNLQYYKTTNTTARIRTSSSSHLFIYLFFVFFYTHLCSSCFRTWIDWPFSFSFSFSFFFESLYYFVVVVAWCSQYIRYYDVVLVFALLCSCNAELLPYKNVFRFCFIFFFMFILFCNAFYVSLYGNDSCLSCFTFDGNIPYVFEPNIESLSLFRFSIVCSTHTHTYSYMDGYNMLCIPIWLFIGFVRSSIGWLRNRNKSTPQRYTWIPHKWCFPSMNLTLIYICHI